MAAVSGFAQLKHRAARHHFAAVVQKDFNQVFQVAQLGLPIDQGHHVHAKGVLQLGLLVQVIENDLWHLAAFELNHHPHAGLVGLVLDVADAFYFFLMYQLGNALEQGLFVDLIGQLIHDDGLALAFVDVFKVALGAHDHASAAGAVALAHALHAVNDAGSRKVWGRHNFHQLIHRSLRVAQQVQAGVDHFVQVVWWDVGGHAHRNTARAVNEQIGQARWQHQGFFFRAVVIGAEINGFFVNVAQHFVGNFGQSDFGVPHGGGVVAVYRAKVALSVHQHMAHRKVLRHTDDGVVNRLVAVRVVLTNHVTHNTRRLFVRAVPVVVELVHGKQHSAVHRLEAVSCVW